MSKKLFAIAALALPILSTGCVYSTLMVQNGVALTTLNQCSANGELFDDAGYVHDRTLTLGSVNRHGIQPLVLTGQQNVIVTFRALDAYGHLVGTTTLSLPVNYYMGTYPATWIIGQIPVENTGYSSNVFYSDIKDVNGQSLCARHLGFLERVRDWVGDLAH